MNPFNFDEDALRKEQESVDEKKGLLGVFGAALQDAQNVPSGYEMLYGKKLERPDIKGSFDAVAKSIQDPTERRGRLYEQYKMGRDFKRDRDAELMQADLKDPKSSRSLMAKAFWQKNGFEVDPNDSEASLTERFGKTSDYTMQKAKTLADLDNKKKLNDYEFDNRIRLAEEEAKLARKYPKAKDPVAVELQDLRKEQMIAEAQKRKREAEEQEFKKSPRGRLQNMSATDKQRFDNVVGSLEAITGMEKAYKQGDNTFSLIGDNDYTRSRSIFEEMLGRMQSGGQINAEERASFRKLAPTALDSTDQQIKKLNDMRRLMEQRYSTFGFDKAQAKDLQLNPEALGFINQEDQKAAAWAMKNPDDPRAKKIMEEVSKASSTAGR